MKKTAIIFPGQGSQYIGMGKELLESEPGASPLMDLAEEVSAFPLRRLCLEGPLPDLTRVLYLQPALTAINLICWQALCARLPDFQPICLAGHSLGEYSALHAAGVLSVEDTLRLVTRRGELMEREGVVHPGGMRAVLGLRMEDIDALLRDFSGPGVVVAANHNTEKQVVLSGDEQGLAAFGALCQEQGGKVIPLQVSVANHSPLVAGAVPDFTHAMQQAVFHAPRIPVVFNVTADYEQDPATIRTIMAGQIASKVRWLESVGRMLADGVEAVVEIGPKNVLTGMMRKIVAKGSPLVCLQADTPEGLDKVAEILRA